MQVQTSQLLNQELKFKRANQVDTNSSTQIGASFFKEQIEDNMQKQNLSSKSKEDERYNIGNGSYPQHYTKVKEQSIVEKQDAKEFLEFQCDMSRTCLPLKTGIEVTRDQVDKDASQNKKFNNQENQAPAHESRQQQVRPNTRGNSVSYNNDQTVCRTQRRNNDSDCNNMSGSNSDVGVMRCASNTVLQDITNSKEKNQGGDDGQKIGDVANIRPYDLNNQIFYQASQNSISNLNIHSLNLNNQNLHDSSQFSTSNLNIHSQDSNKQNLNEASQLSTSNLNIRSYDLNNQNFNEASQFLTSNLNICPYNLNNQNLYDVSQFLTSNLNIRPYDLKNQNLSSNSNIYPQNLNNQNLCEAAQFSSSKSSNMCNLKQHLTFSGQDKFPYASYLPVNKSDNFIQENVEFEFQFPIQQNIKQQNENKIKIYECATDKLQSQNSKDTQFSISNLNYICNQQKPLNKKYFSSSSGKFDNFIKDNVKFELKYTKQQDEDKKKNYQYVVNKLHSQNSEITQLSCSNLNFTQNLKNPLKFFEQEKSSISYSPEKSENFVQESTEYSVQQKIKLQNANEQNYCEYKADKIQSQNSKDSQFLSPNMKQHLLEFENYGSNFFSSPKQSELFVQKNNSNSICMSSSEHTQIKINRQENIEFAENISTKFFTPQKSSNCSSQEFFTPINFDSVPTCSKKILLPENEQNIFEENYSFRWDDGNVNLQKQNYINFGQNSNHFQLENLKFGLSDENSTVENSMFKPNSENKSQNSQFDVCSQQSRSEKSKILGQNFLQSNYQSLNQVKNENVILNDQKMGKNLKRTNMDENRYEDSLQGQIQNFGQNFDQIAYNKSNNNNNNNNNSKIYNFCQQQCYHKKQTSKTSINENLNEHANNLNHVIQDNIYEQQASNTFSGDLKTTVLYEQSSGRSEASKNLQGAESQVQKIYDEISSEKYFDGDGINWGRRGYLNEENSGCGFSRSTSFTAFQGVQGDVESSGNSSVEGPFRNFTNFDENFGDDFWQGQQKIKTHDDTYPYLLNESEINYIADQVDQLVLERNQCSQINTLQVKKEEQFLQDWELLRMVQLATIQMKTKVDENKNSIMKLDIKNKRLEEELKQLRRRLRKINSISKELISYDT